MDESFSVLYAVARLKRIPGSTLSANILQEHRVSFKKVQAQLASFNSNRVDIYTYRLATRARLLFLFSATFIASTH